MMNRDTFLLALLTFIVVVLTTPLQIVGLPVAPLAGLLIGVLAGWWTARTAGAGDIGSGLRVGAIVGVAALLGSMMTLAVLASAVGSIPSIQDAVRLSEPHPEARIPTELIAPLAGVAGVVAGLALGLVELILAALGGAAGALVYDRRHPA